MTPDTRDPLANTLIFLLVLAGLGALGYVGWLFVSVVFLGGGSSCPQNLC